MSDDKKAEEVVEAEVAEKPALKAGEVALCDEGGNYIGVVLKVDHSKGDEPYEQVTGWTTLSVDGEPYTFSKERARLLLARFPHFADQVRAGAKKGR